MSEMSRKWATVLLFGLICLISVLVFSCDNQEKIVLRYTSPFSPNHPLSIADARALDKIENESNGMIHFQRYFGGTLVNFTNCVVEITGGVADIGLAVANMAPSGFKILKSMFLTIPGIDDIPTMRRIHEEVNEKYPQLFGDWDNYGKVVAKSFPGSYNLFLKNPFTKLTDLKGMTIKSVSSQIPIFMQLGAEGVDMPITEAYVSISKGVTDGAMAGWEQLKSMKLAEVTNYYIEMGLTDIAGHVRLVNWDTWNKLPPDIQQIFEDNYQFWGAECDKEMIKADQEGIEFAEDLGNSIIKLSQDDARVFHDIVDFVIRENTARADGEGLPATEAYEEIIRLIKKYEKPNVNKKE